MPLELPQGLKLVHEMRIPVRWGDLDAMGHVNNTIYFRYFESLRIEWLNRFDAPPKRENRLVAPTDACEHKPDRCVAGPVARQRQRAEAQLRDPLDLGHRAR